jgi:hypothetical protein
MQEDVQYFIPSKQYRDQITLFGEVPEDKPKNEEKQQGQMPDDWEKQLMR